MRKLTLAVSLCMIAFVAISANVVWDNVTLSHEGTYDEVRYYSIVYPYVSFTGTMSGSVLTLWADANEYMEISSMWCLANKGAEVSVESVVDSETYFYAADFAKGDEIGSVKTDYPISVEDGASVYLETICKTHTRPEDVVVGWIELALDNGVLRVAHSAIDLDGGPMIVGGGAAGPIPEPTGGVLVLFGAALLALRRKRVRGRPHGDLVHPRSR